MTTNNNNNSSKFSNIVMVIILIVIMMITIICLSFNADLSHNSRVGGLAAAHAAEEHQARARAGRAAQRLYSIL